MHPFVDVFNDGITTFNNTAFFYLRQRMKGATLFNCKGAAETTLVGQFMSYV